VQSQAIRKKPYYAMLEDAVSPPPSLKLVGHNGFLKSLSTEALSVICLRPHAIPEAVATSHTHEVFTHFAKQLGTTVDAMLTGWANNATLLNRLPTLDEIASFAAFVASDSAGAMTGAIANLTCGALVD
jgi:3-oxoacyl-[acyl-carrier protein] reductase